MYVRTGYMQFIKRNFAQTIACLKKIAPNASKVKVTRAVFILVNHLNKHMQLQELNNIGSELNWRELFPDLSDRLGNCEGKMCLVKTICTKPWCNRLITHFGNVELSDAKPQTQVSDRKRSSRTQLKMLTNTKRGDILI